jgi:hypothetical protein
MSAAVQSLNQAMLGAESLLETNTLNAVPTGAADTSILRFNVDPADTSTYTVTTTAADGTVILILEPGMYLATLDFVFADAVSIAAGISFGAATAAAIVADPVVAVAGVIASADVDGDLNGDQPIHLEVAFEARAGAVTLALAGSTGAGTARVMFHATNSAGAAPAGITAASAQYRVQRLSPIYG